MSNSAEAIRWRDWNEESFMAARQEEKRVLLTLTATWCHWCHVMDQTSYANPRVVELVNSQFIPVRVDVDRRPDISRRYNQGGFPTVAILNDQGELIAGRVYAPPDQMVSFLEQAEGMHRVGAVVKPSLADDHGAPLVTVPAKRERESTSNAILERLRELYDPEFGGFGREPKQPPWEALRFLLAVFGRSGDKSLLGMVVNTLEGMRAGLYDQNGQGFFRYSVARDWRVPHYEKMIVTNANMAWLYLEAYQVTGRRTYKDVAMGVLDYLLRTLYDSGRGAFYASQDAGEDYYRLPWKDRAQDQSPSIDRTFYTGWNALAAAALVKAYAVLGTPSYLEVAARVLDLLWREAWQPDVGVAHVVEGTRDQPLVLDEHVQFLRASLVFYQATGNPEHLKRAIAIAQSVQSLFGAGDGGYYDTADVYSPSAGRLAQDKPVLENSLLAEALMGLSCLTGQEEYLTWAADSLNSFQDVVPGSSFIGPKGSRHVEEDEEALFLPAGSAWGRAWDMLESGPVHLVLVGTCSHPAARSLLKATLSLFAPHGIVQSLDPERDQDRIASLGFPAKSPPALYACMGGICLPPITTPQEVRKLKSTRPWASWH